MKRSIWLYIFTVLLFTGLLSGCYPDKIDYMDEYDLAGTTYDKNADFGSYTTFTVVDTIVHITDDGKDDPNLSRDYDDQVLDLIRENMTGKGYTEIASPDSMNMPDLVLFVEAVSSDYFQYWGGYWGDYWGWYPGWDMWYPGYPGYYPWYPSYPWYPGYVTSYTTGTLLVEMFDATTFDPEDRTADVLWLGIVDGLLSGSSQNMAARLEKQINQLFIQSDYLEK
jgi:hypothetical protein